MLLKRRRPKGQALEPKWLQKPDFSDVYGYCQCLLLLLVAIASAIS